MYIERFEYFCPDCKKKGIVTDVLLNPELMIIRGRCPTCNLQSAYKAVDISYLQAEYQGLPESTRGEYQMTDEKGSTLSFLRFKVRGT